MNNTQLNVELIDENTLAVLPELVGAIETLRGWLIAMVNNTASTHDMGAIDDAIARSGHLLRRTNGEDVTAAVAAYEQSLNESPHDEANYDDDFGRYGSCDDYPDVDPYRD